MPHRREDEGDLLLVLVDVDRLGAHLDHEHQVKRRIEPGEGAEILTQLVAEDQDEGSDRHKHLSAFVPSCYEANRWEVQVKGI